MIAQLANRRVYTPRKMETESEKDPLNESGCEKTDRKSKVLYLKSQN